MGHVDWDDSKQLEADVDVDLDVDAEFGGPAARRALERRLLRKVDRRMAILVLIYILNFIDRNNASAARLRGFEENLGLHGQQFATILAGLYVGYISMQIPSNMFMNHIGKPSLYLPGCMSIWGLLSIMTGFAQNYHDVLLTRFVLGIVEASFFPGALFLLSRWYTRTELGLRMALLSCGSLLSNAFGALLASALLDRMDGVYGRAAWRWLFFAEGSLTVLVALAAALVLPDFPETARPRWLTAAELRLAVHRMQADALNAAEGCGAHDDAGALHGLWLALGDPNAWILVAAMFSQIVGTAFTMWFPTIVATLGYNHTVTLLLCAPPYVLTTVVAFYVSRHSDAKGERFYHVSVPLWVGILGLCIAMSTTNTTTRYISLFLMMQACAGFAVFYGWMSNCFPSPPAKRAVALALINAVSQLGNIVAAYVFQSAWGPRYTPSFVICIVACLASIACCYALRRRLAAMNAALRCAELELGESKAGFRYLL